MDFSNWKPNYSLMALLLIALSTRAPAAPPSTPTGETKTKVEHDAPLSRLTGRHKLTLQWLGWDHPGKAEVKEENGLLHLTGEQREFEGSGSLALDGVVLRVTQRTFLFRGTIVTTVSFINGGRPCKREGTFTFAIYGKRRYWRLKEMQNPCEDVVDYVDLYFR